MLKKIKNSTEAKIALLLALGVLLIYGQTIFFNFIALDDSKHIWSNNYVGALTLRHLKFFWVQPYYGLYIPVVYNTWTALAELTQALGLTHPVSGYSAHLFHFTNTFLHLINSFLVFQLFYLLIMQKSPTDQKQKSLWVAGFATSFFALHPIQVEAVAWASGLKDVLSTTLALITIILFFRFFFSQNERKKKSRKQKKNIESDSQSKPQTSPFPIILRSIPLNKNRGFIYLLSFGFFLLALFTKPNVVIVPAFLFVLILFWFKAHARLRTLTLFFAACVPIIYLTKTLQPNARLDFTLELWQYPFIALHSLGFYVGKIILPFQLAPDYGLSPSVALSSEEYYWYIPLGLSPLVLGFYGFLKKKKALFVGATAFLLGLLPVMGFVPFEYQNMSSVADRYLYFIPFLGVGLIAISCIQWLDLKNIKTATVFLGFTFTVISFQQTRHWKDNSQLFAQVLSVNPKSYLSLNNLGLVHLRAQEFAPAEAYFEKALKIKPDYTAAQSNLGVVYFKQKMYDKTISHYTGVLKDHPHLGAGSSATFADMHYNLGAALLNSGKTAESIKHLEKAAEININHFAAQFHRGRVYAHIGHLEKAKDAFLQAYRINPRSSEVVDELKNLRNKGVKF